MNAKLNKILKENREIGTLDNPEFNRSRKCHDWRNYIPDDLREAWKELTYEARVAAFSVALPIANGENWDD